MPQEVSQITLRGSRNPDSWKAVLEYKIENMPRISRVGFLLAHHRRADRGGIEDPKLVPQLGEDSLEPLRVPGCLPVALTAMMKDGLTNRERASEIAHMVLHGNAARLYGLQNK